MPGYAFPFSIPLKEMLGFMIKIKQEQGLSSSSDRTELDFIVANAHGESVSDPRFDANTSALCVQPPIIPD